MRDILKKKMYREIVSPSLNKTKALMYVLRFVFKIFEFVINILKKPILNFFFKNTHVVAYDLSLDPLTFDYLYFLSFSDYSRKIKKKKELKIFIFLPSNLESLFESSLYYEKISYSKRLKRVIRIIKGSSELISPKTNLNFFKNYLFFRFCYFISSNNSLLDSKILPEKIKYPLHLKNLKLRNYNFLKPSKVSNIRIKEWLSNNFDEKKILTFTMRNSPYQKFRNSNLENWTRLNSALNKKYNILVLPDYENEYNENYIISKFKGAKVLPKFLGENVSNRLAVYKNSFYNLGVSSGPMGLCYLSDCYFIQFKTINDKFESTSRQQLLKLGMFSKNNFFFLGKNQKIIQNFNEDTEYMFDILNQTIQ